MRLLKMVPVLALVFAFTGCISSTTVVNVKADGSGTIETTTLMAKAALEQIKAMAESFGGKEGKGAKGADPFSQADLKAAAAKMGEGVTFVSSQPIKTADMEGVKAVYAFKDITKVRVSQKPNTPGGSPSGAGAQAESAADQVSFRFARQPNGNAVLTLVFPELKPGDKPERKKPGASKAEPKDKAAEAQQIAMAKALLKGLKVDLAVAVDGRIVKTNSPYVAGNRVTIFEMDFEQLLADESKLSQIQEINSIEEAKQAFKDVKGFKMNLDREVRVEFAPR